MKEPMKCERTVRTHNRFIVCNGEMEDKGILPLSEFGMVTGTQIIRQCTKCKDIKIV